MTKNKSKSKKKTPLLRLVSAFERTSFGVQYHERPRERRDRAILFVFPHREKGLEQFIYRLSRPVNLYRELLPDIFKALGLPADTKARWSWKAGCSCPCSPGFILSHRSPYNYQAVVAPTAKALADAAKTDRPADPRRVARAASIAAGGV